MSNLKVGMMMAAVTALLALCGHLLGGVGGMVIAIVLAAVMNLGTFWFSDKLVIKMTRAQPLTREQSPELFDSTQELAQRAGIPMPRLYLVNDPSPNAFATGRNPENGVVALNTGLLNLLDRDEVMGVVAHELAHIKHRDTLTSAIVATMAGAISSIGNMAMFAGMFAGSDEDRPHPIAQLFMMLVAPLAAMLIQFAVSRAREFEADKTAAEIIGTGRGLRSALLRLEQGVAAAPPSHMSPSHAHMCIVSPLAGGASLAKLFSTHPPIAERARRLEELETQRT